MVEGPAVELSWTGAGEPGELELVCGGDRFTFPRTIDARDDAFTVTVPLEALRGEAEEEAEWTLACAARGRVLPLLIDPALRGSRWRSDGSELSLARTDAGAVVLTERDLAPRALLERDPLEDVRDPLAGVD